MDRLLAVVDTTETAKRVVSEAGEIAEGVDADLLLICVTNALEYSSQRESMESLTSDSEHYTRNEAREGATKFARDIGMEVLSELDIEYEAKGYLGDKAEKILEVADRYDCDHIFLPGRRRSPTGKALFGDVTQRVILDFDGLATVITD